MSQTIIQVENVNKQIKGNQILNNINLIIQEGESCGIVGQNASGKSMLFKAICGLLRVDSGSIVVCGQNIARGGCFPPNTGVLIEHPGFLPQFSGYKNLKLLAEIQDIIDDKRIFETMECVGLDSKDKRPYRKYSLGMKQKLGIAQALMEHPRLLILDEPMNNLDIESVQRMRTILSDLVSSGITLLITSHNKEDIEVLCTNLYFMDRGVLTKDMKS